MTSKAILSERSQTQKVICYMTPFIGYTQSRQIHRDRKQIIAYQGIGKEGNGEQLLSGYKVFLWHGEKVLKPERGGGCTTL